MGIAGIALMVSGIMRIANASGCNRSGAVGTTIEQSASSTTSAGADDASKSPRGFSADSASGDGSSSSDATSATGGTFVPDSPSSSASSTADPSTSASSTTDASDRKDYAQGRSLSFLDDTELTDAHGNPSFYAAMELEGWQLNTLAQEQGFTWTEAEGGRAWASGDGTMVWGYVGGGSFLSDDEIAGLSKGAAGSPVFYLCIVSGYGSEMEVYRAMSNSVDSSSAVGPFDDYVFVVYGPSMKEHLVTISDEEDGDFEVVIYNPEVIAAGGFDAAHELPNGVDSYGSTVREVFETYTGATYGDHLTAE